MIWGKLEHCVVGVIVVLPSNQNFRVFDWVDAIDIAIDVETQPSLHHLISDEVRRQREATVWIPGQACLWQQGISIFYAHAFG
jgi:hypothetical protein